MPRITGKDAEGLMAAYAKVHAPKEEEVAVEAPVAETPVEDIQERTRLKDDPRVQALRNTAKAVNLKSGEGPVTVSSVNQSGTPQRVQTTTTNINSKSSGINRGGGSLQQAAANIDAMRSPASGSRQVKPGLIGNLLGKGPAQQAQPQARPVAQAAPQAKPVAQAQAQRTVGGQGNRQTAVKTGGIQLGKSIRGGLGALGNLAGRAVGGIKQGVQSAASNIKQGVQAVGNALQNKGPIQGRSGANAAMKAKGLPGATGGSGGTAPLAKPVAKPVAQAPVAKPVAQKLTPAQQAQKMAKDRIAAGRNTVTGELKSKPKVRKITSVMDMEGYDLIDDTVNFLISEGYVANESDALSIMSEPEFMESFNTGLSEVLNESSENNK